MSEIVGKMLEILEVPEVMNLYKTKMQTMQPAELVRRLENEQLSTRGQMPELRGRLLRFEVKKSHPHVQVPWFPEDNASETLEDEEKMRPSSKRVGEVALNEFFKLVRYQEKKVSGVQKDGSYHGVLDELEAGLQSHLAQWRDPEDFEEDQCPNPTGENLKSRTNVFFLEKLDEDKPSESDESVDLLSVKDESFDDIDQDTTWRESLWFSEP